MVKPPHKEKVQRSVDSLERLFSVVVALAITIAVEKTLFDSAGQLYPWTDVNGEHVLVHQVALRLPALLGFLVSIVPFYHGMNRHLDITYIEHTVPRRKEGFLILDFVAFFLESCLLVALASLVDNCPIAFLVLVLLLSVDVLWAWIVHGIHYSDIDPSTITWTKINALAIPALLVIVFSNIFPEGLIRNLALCGAATIRTVCDYYFCWEFYFPKSQESAVESLPEIGP